MFEITFANLARFKYVFMFSENKPKYLFRCDKCNMILSTEFEDEKDVDDVKEDKILLECPCGGMCFVLRD